MCEPKHIYALQSNVAAIMLSSHGFLLIFQQLSQQVHGFDYLQQHILVLST